MSEQHHNKENDQTVNDDEIAANLLTNIRADAMSIKTALRLIVASSAPVTIMKPISLKVNRKETWTFC